MKAQSEVQVQLYSFFNLGARRGWVVHAMPRSLYPQEGDPGGHCIGDWMGPRAGLDKCESSQHHWDSIFGPSSL